MRSNFYSFQGNLLLILATNRSETLDSALLRPGRVDRVVPVPPPNGISGIKSVLETVTLKTPLAEDVDLTSLAEILASKAVNSAFSGADLEAVVREAAFEALGRESAEVHQCDFEAALRKVTPSVTQEAIARFANFSERYRII